MTRLLDAEWCEVKWNPMVWAMDKVKRTQRHRPSRNWPIRKAFCRTRKRIADARPPPLNAPLFC